LGTSDIYFPVVIIGLPSGVIAAVDGKEYSVQRLP
jgi:hypothetical protein